MKSPVISDFDSDRLAAACEMVQLFTDAKPRRFRDFIERFIDRYGLTLEQVQPYARIAYSQIRDDMELDGHDVADMDSSAAVIAEIRTLQAADEMLKCMVHQYRNDITRVEERHVSMEPLDHLLARNTISAVTNARQVVMRNYDDGELTSAERDAEMDILDQQLVQLAIFAASMARKVITTRADNGELTFAEQSAELRSIDHRFSSLFQTEVGHVPAPTKTQLQEYRGSPILNSTADETETNSLDLLIRLQSAAKDFASAEAKRIIRAVTENMRGRPAQGMFGEVAARHMWDEYCWSLQEGPFDDDMGWDDVQLGSLSGAFDGMVRAVIEAEIEKLPRHAQVFLSAKAIEDDLDMDEDALGSIWLDGMVALIIEGVNSEASCRNLDLIGPERGDVIGYEIGGSGIVWSLLSDRGEAMDLVQSHVDTMIDPDGDLSDLASEMVDAYIASAIEEADGTTVSELYDKFEDQIRDLLTERDVLPALEDMRAGLLERLDG